MNRLTAFVSWFWLSLTAGAFGAGITGLGVAAMYVGGAPAASGVVVAMGGALLYCAVWIFRHDYECWKQFN